MRFWIEYLPVCFNSFTIHPFFVHVTNTVSNSIHSICCKLVNALSHGFCHLATACFNRIFPFNIGWISCETIEYAVYSNLLKHVQLNVQRKINLHFLDWFHKSGGKINYSQIKWVISASSRFRSDDFTIDCTVNIISFHFNFVLHFLNK